MNNKRLSLIRMSNTTTNKVPVHRRRNRLNSFARRLCHLQLALLWILCLANPVTLAECTRDHWLAKSEPAKSGPANDGPPNVVLIISDDQAWTDYGFMGHPEIETPHLDRLAAGSAVFTRGYVPTALCRPSLATLITGLYAHQHRITGNDPALLPEMIGPNRVQGEPAAYLQQRAKLISFIDRQPTVPKLLAERGYLSHQSGKWWEGNYCQGGFTHGMTRGFPEVGGRHGDDGLTIGRSSMAPLFEFIDEASDAQRPFFAWYAPFLPHTPHNPPARLLEKYKRKGIESDSIAKYYAMVEWFDETCGELIQHLDDKQLRRNTLIIYVGDNGWIQLPNGPGYAPRSKQSANEGGTRQPTMFCWPGVIQPGLRGEQLCSAIDIVPTILSAAEATVPPNLPGINLLPALKAGTATPRQEVFGETFAHDIADLDQPEASLLYRWVIKDRWKLLLTYDGQVGPDSRSHPRAERRPQLFDLIADPHEERNLAADHPELVQRLGDKLQSWWPVTQRKVQTTWESAAISPRRPNVLLIAIDDQNDWIGCLQGHPLAQTPHLDALAKRGTLFQNAHCQAPLCNPSRTSMLLGLRPTTTGVYGLEPWFREVAEWQDRVTLPQYFAMHGYQTLAAGKVFHHGTSGPTSFKATGSQSSPEFSHRGPSPGVGVRPPIKLIPPTPMGNHPLMDWGTFPHRDEDKGDYQVASWAIQQIQQATPDQPFFLAAGFFLPHVPCYTTQPWLDLYPDDDRVLPSVVLADRDDTPRFSWYLHWNLPEPRLAWLHEHNQWRHLVRSYLASTSFVDAQIGRVLEALQVAGLDDNTIVVIWSDHGFHLGEKSITGKNSLWEDGTRVPLIFVGPGVRLEQSCRQPAELLDIYPTLIELCDLPPRNDLDGLSLVPQLQDQNAIRIRPALTSHNPGNHAVRSQRYRYVRYADGSEELYDHADDPHEWHNLVPSSGEIREPHLAAIVGEHRKWLPTSDHPPVAGSAHRVLIYDAETDIANWENTPIRRSDVIPQ